VLSAENQRSILDSPQVAAWEHQRNKKINILTTFIDLRILLTNMVDDQVWDILSMSSPLK
jgi:hypothetical protein